MFDCCFEMKLKVFMSENANKFVVENNASQATAHRKTRDEKIKFSFSLGNVLFATQPNDITRSFFLA